MEVEYIPPELLELVAACMGVVLQTQQLCVAVGNLGLCYSALQCALNGWKRAICSCASFVSESGTVIMAFDVHIDNVKTYEISIWHVYRVYVGRGLQYLSLSEAKVFSDSSDTPVVWSIGNPFQSKFLPVSAINDLTATISVLDLSRKNR